MYRDVMAAGDPHFSKDRISRIRRLFVTHGYSGHLWVLDDQPDEAVFLVAVGTLASVRDRALSIELRAVVDRGKVWVIEESEEWRKGARQLW
jgi:hypothetical protein